VILQRAHSGGRAEKRQRIPPLARSAPTDFRMALRKLDNHMQAAGRLGLTTINERGSSLPDGGMRFRFSALQLLKETRGLLDQLA
jgi:hypothetical protein